MRSPAGDSLWVVDPLIFSYRQISHMDWDKDDGDMVSSPSLGEVETALLPLLTLAKRRRAADMTKSSKVVIPREWGLMAFWPSDEYPFLLYGVITRFKEDGMVETVGYGPGFYFRPAFILPITAGEQLVRDLKHLKQKYKDAHESVNRDLNAELFDRLHGFGVKSIAHLKDG